MLKQRKAAKAAAAKGAHGEQCAVIKPLAQAAPVPAAAVTPRDAELPRPGAAARSNVLRELLARETIPMEKLVDELLEPYPALPAPDLCRHPDPDFHPPTLA